MRTYTLLVGMLAFCVSTGASRVEARCFVPTPESEWRAPIEQFDAEKFVRGPLTADEWAEEYVKGLEEGILRPFYEWLDNQLSLETFHKPKQAGAQLPLPQDFAEYVKALRKIGEIQCFGDALYRAIEERLAKITRH